jgi:hypothetical protein
MTDTEHRYRKIVYEFYNDFTLTKLPKHKLTLRQIPLDSDIYQTNFSHHHQILKLIRIGIPHYSSSFITAPPINYQRCPR